MDLILASASPRRSELLRQAGFTDLRIIPAVNVEEIEPPEEYAHYAALRNAELKAHAVSDEYPDDLVIGADTVIEFGKDIIGKPGSEDEAKQILARLAGKTHCVTTGVAICCKSKGIKVFFNDMTLVTFRPFGPEVIDDYMSKVNVMDKAGAYGIQEHGDMLVEKVEGSISNVIGLPVERIAETLHNIGL